MNSKVILRMITSKNMKMKEMMVMMKGGVGGGGLRRGCISNATAAAALCEHQVSLEYHQCSQLCFTKYDWNLYGFSVNVSQPNSSYISSCVHGVPSVHPTFIRCPQSAISAVNFDLQSTI